MKRPFPWDKKYLHWGVTIFLVVACSILFFSAVSQWAYLREFSRAFFVILAPFIWGLIIAYMLTPVAKWLERLLHKLFRGRYLGGEISPKGKRPLGTRLVRAFSVSITVVLTLLIVVLSLVHLLPQLYASVEGLILNIPGYLTVGVDFIQRTLDDIPALEAVAINLLEEGQNFLLNWVNESLLPNMDIVIIAVSAGFFGVVRVIFNFLLGMVLSVYIMYNREKFSAQLRKILYSLMPEKRVLTIYQGLQYLDRAFGRFFLGRVLDCLFIGTTTFIFLSIFQMPYVALVTVIVGVTNFIPFFGPFIGGIPSAILILMENPVQGLIFIIFIIVLQQIDGNIIGPRILANTTGLSGYWILFSLLVGGGLFGFAGMIVGVPVFSVLYAGIRHLTNRRLERKAMSTDTMAYTENPAKQPEEESPKE